MHVRQKTYWQKIKLLKRQKELKLEIEKEKAYLELAEAQKNLNLADIKKNNVARCTISLLDHNSYDRQDILEKDIESKKYNPV